MNARLRNVGMVLVAAAVFFVMVRSIGATAAWSDEPAGLGGEEAQMTPLVEGLFGTHVVALEVLGVLLTAAMIGALVIARPLGVAPDSSNYSSDPELHPGSRGASPAAAAQGWVATDGVEPSQPAPPRPAGAERSDTTGASRRTLGKGEVEL